MSPAPQARFGSRALLRDYARTATSALSRSRSHAAASATLAGGYCAQLAFQMAYFLLLTRMLGPELFGRFAAALAVINLVSPLAGIGFGEVALFRISQDPRKTGLWAANATMATAAMGGLVALGLALATGAIGSDHWIDWHLMLGLAVSELVLVRCCAVIARVHQARREITRTSLIHVAVAALKAAIAFGLFVAGRESLLALVLLLDLCFSPLLFLVCIKLARQTATPVCWSHLWTDMRFALSFATGVACKAVYTDLDKVFLARWTTPFVVGTYAAGYKILALAFMPIRAILEATFPRQVELASGEPHQCLRFTASLLALSLALASVIAGLIFLLAPWAVYLLGDDYHDSVGVLRLGFLLPVLQAIHYTLGNYLTAMGRQSVRTAIQLVVLATYIVAGMIVIPLYSWQGAIATSVGCETLLVGLFAVACTINEIRRRPRPGIQ